MAEVIYNFDTAQWANLKQSIKDTPQPNRNVSFCTDYGFCNRYMGYFSYGYGKYSDHNNTIYGTYHTNSHTQYFPRYYQHKNSASYSTSHYNYKGYANDAQTYQQSYHGNYIKQSTGHSHSKGHANVCNNNYIAYTKGYDYCDRSDSHYNTKDYCYECSQSYGYSDSVALKTNLPNAPVLLGTESGDIPRLAKTVTLAMFAYDKDYNLSSASNAEKRVYYDLYVQRIQDVNGNLLTGQQLTKVLSNVQESAIGEGITFALDTTKYSEGYYRFIGVARNVHNKYYMQDVPGSNITASGNYNGSDLFSGLSFPKGTRANTASANTVKLKAGTRHEMVSIVKVLIKQNTPSFLSVKNAYTSILNFIFANDDSGETDEGRYGISADVKQVYGQNGIADGDPYIALRGWTKGVVAKIEVEEQDTAQYIKVTGALYRKSDGKIIPNSTTTAQFPINKSTPSSYTEIKKAGGSGVKMEAYLYWPATLFNTSNLKNGLEDIEIRLTTYEYENADGTTLVDAPRVTSSIETYADETESPTKNVFKIDKFSPSVSNNAIQNTWQTSATVKITVDDRFLNNALNSSGSSSNLNRILIKVVNRNTGEIIDTYDWTTKNKVIPANAKSFSKSITITAPVYYDNIGLDITAWDKVGNVKTQSISNIKIDNSTTAITISPMPTDNWSRTQITPQITFSKPGGKPFTKIQIAETNSPTPPKDGNSAWTIIASQLDTDYTYQTTSAGRVTNTHYVHVIVDDDLHQTIRQTFGPYKVDLEAPNVAITSTAGMWMYEPTVSISVADSAVGSKLKSVKYTWKKTDGTEGGTKTIDLSGLNTSTYNGTYIIDIPDGSYENNISCIVEVIDNAGNVFMGEVTNLMADKTVPVISINPVNDGNWHKTKINTITTISKSAGAPCSVIKIAETNSSTPPNEDSSDWKDVAISGGGAIYPNQKTGQMSGQHYVHVWVEKGTFDPNNPSSKKIIKTFGPYKIDLILPEMTNFQVESSYVQKYGWYWEEPTFNVSVLDNGGSQMKEVKYKVSTSPIPSEVDNTWQSIPPAETLFPITFPEGSHYIHVHMQDNALNDQLRTNPPASPISVDTKNPKINIEITEFGEKNESGKVVGYVNVEISADDETSGIKIAKYAITDSPTPPSFSVIGNNNVVNLGRTDGWIDFSAYSDIGVSVDLRAPGESYIYVYVEDYAGRKYNSILSTVNAPDTEGIYQYEHKIDIQPTYLYELDIDTSSDNPVVDRDSESMLAGVKNVFAIKNISNITNFNLHYVNYRQNAQQTLKIDIIECRTEGDDEETEKIVRTSKTLVNFDEGDTQMDDIRPYSFPVWWVNGKTGQKLPSGVYEVRASLLEGDKVINSISAFAIIKQNTLIQPEIRYNIVKNETFIYPTYTEDTFYEELKDREYTDTLVKNFIEYMSENHKTKYYTKLIDRSGNPLGDEPIINHNPDDINGRCELSLEPISKFVTVIATIEDAFGNIARASRVVDFFEDKSLPDDDEGSDDESGININDKTTTVRVIETPSADNYIINGSKQVKDEIDEKNPFDFLPDPDDDE